MNRSGGGVLSGSVDTKIMSFLQNSDVLLTERLASLDIMAVHLRKLHFNPPYITLIWYRGI